jgi:hypothetical protein
MLLFIEFMSKYWNVTMFLIGVASAVVGMYYTIKDHARRIAVLESTKVSESLTNIEKKIIHIETTLEFIRDNMSHMKR